MSSRNTLRGGVASKRFRALLLTLAILVMASFAGVTPVLNQTLQAAQAAPGDTGTRSFTSTSKSVQSTWVARSSVGGVQPGRVIATKEVGQIVAGQWQALKDPLPPGGGEVTYRYKFEYYPGYDSNYEGRVIFTPKWYDQNDREYSAAQLNGTRIGGREIYDFRDSQPKISDDGCGQVDFNNLNNADPANGGGITGFSAANGWEYVDPANTWVGTTYTFRTGGWAIKADPIQLNPHSGDKSPAYLYCTTNVTETTTSTLTVENMVFTSISDYNGEDFFATQGYFEALNDHWSWTGGLAGIVRNVDGNYPLQVPLTVEVTPEPLPARDSRISVTKTADKQTVMQGGENVTYTYEVTNTIPERFGDRGRMYYQNVSDDKCPGVGHVSGLTNDGTGNYYIPAGQAAVFSCTMNVTLATTNTVTASFKNNSDGQISQATDSATVRVRNPNLPPPENRITLEMRVDKPVASPGEQVTIYYKASSLLNDTLSQDRNLMKYSDVRGEDLCKNTSLTLVSSGGVKQGGNDPNGTYLEPGGFVEYSCTYQVPDSAAGQTLTERGTAEFDNEYDNQRSTATDSVQFKVRSALPDPANRVSLAKTASTDYLPYGGGEVTYRYTVKNLIPGDYSDAEHGKLYLDDLVDDKCSPVELVSGTSTETVGGVEKRVLYPQESATFQCAGSLSATTTNTATLTMTNAGDNQRSTKTAQATVEVATSPAYPDKSKWARFEMTPSVTELPDGGGEVTYTYTLTNLIPVETDKPREFGRLYLDSFSDDVCQGAGVDLRNKLHVDDQGIHPGVPKPTHYIDAGETVVFTCTTNITATTTNHAEVQLSNIDPDPQTRKAPLLESAATVTVMPPIPAPENRISVTKSALEPGNGAETSDGKVYYEDQVRYTVTVKSEIPVEFNDRPAGRMHLDSVSDPLCTLNEASGLHQDADGKYLLPGEEASWTCTKAIEDETTVNTATAQFKHLTSGQTSTVKSNTVTITAEDRPVPGRIDCSAVVTGSDVVGMSNYSSYNSTTSGKIGTITNINADAHTFDTAELEDAIPDFSYTTTQGYVYQLKGGTAALAVNPRSSNEVFYSIRNTTQGYLDGEVPHNGIFKFDNATGQHTQMVTWNETKSMVRLGFDANYTLWSIDNNANIQSYQFQVDGNGNTISDGKQIQQHGLFRLPEGHGNFADKGSGDLAFDGLGNMWVITSETGGGTGVGELYVVPASELEGNDGATAVYVGKMGNHEYVGLAFDEQGNLWASDSRTRTSRNDNASHLYLVDTATGKATDVGEVGTNIHDLASCALPKPELRINKDADPTGGPIPGEEITYRITIENIGNLHAIGMKFKDLMPAGATYVAGSMRMTVSKLDAQGQPSRTEFQWQNMPDNPDGTTYFNTPQLIKSPSALNPGVIDYKKASEETAPPPIIIEFKMKPDYPQKANTNADVCNQAEASFVGKIAQMSDDPSKPGLADKSCTRVIQPNIGIDKKSSTTNEAGERSDKVSVERVGEEVTYDYVVTTDPTQPKFNNNSPTDQPKGLPEETRFNKTLDVAEGVAPDKLPTTPAGNVAPPFAEGLTQEYWQSLVGTEPLKDVVVTDDKCLADDGSSAVQPVTEQIPDLDDNGNQKANPTTGEPLYKDVNIGDDNNDGLLDAGEKWKYSCDAKITGPTENIAKVSATGNRSNHPVNDTDKWFVDSPVFKIQKLASATLTADDIANGAEGKAGDATWKTFGDGIRPDANGKGTAVYQVKVTNVSQVKGFGDVVIDIPTPPSGVTVTGLRSRLWTVDESTNPPTRKAQINDWTPDSSGRHMASAPELEPGKSFEIEILVDYKIDNLATVDWTKLQTCSKASGQTASTGLFNKVDMTADSDGPENNEACVPILPPNVDMQVHKFARNCDADQATCDLQGAEFVIYDAKPTAGGTFNEVCVANPDTSAGQPAQVCSFFDNTVEVDGKQVTSSIFKSVPLEYNKSYWLLETQAPSGFTLLPGPVEFRIIPDNPDTSEDESGVKLWDGDHAAANPSGSESDLITVVDVVKQVPKLDEQGKPVLDEAGKPVLEDKVFKGVQLNIENASAKAILPKAGRLGFIPYLAVGMAMLIGAGLILKKDTIKARIKR